MGLNIALYTTSQHWSLGLLKFNQFVGWMLG